MSSDRSPVHFPLVNGGNGLTDRLATAVGYPSIHSSTRSRPCSDVLDPLRRRVLPAESERGITHTCTPYHGLDCYCLSSCYPTACMAAVQPASVPCGWPNSLLDPQPSKTRTPPRRSRSPEAAGWLAGWPCVESLVESLPSLFTANRKTSLPRGGRRMWM
jgi:hypothetical protein